MGLLTNTKQNHIIKETDPKGGCFVGFRLDRLTITSAHTHKYHYPLFESGMKTGL